MRLLDFYRAGKSDAPKVIACRYITVMIIEHFSVLLNSSRIVVLLYNPQIKVDTSGRNLTSAKIAKYQACALKVIELRQLENPLLCVYIFLC